MKELPYIHDSEEYRNRADTNAFSMAERERHNAFKQLAELLMKWMAENCHPHTTAIITQSSAELLESAIGFTTTEFLVD